MTTLLVPVDGSDAANRAVQYAIDLARRWQPAARIELLTVQPATRGDVAMFLNKKQVKDYQSEEGEKALAGARALLDGTGLDYSAHIGVGQPAGVIAQFEKSLGASQICMGTHGSGSVANLVFGSVAQKVIHLCKGPVTLVK